MPITNAFIEAVKEMDITSIRIMMKDSMLVDTSFREFKEMEKAASGVNGLYEAFNGEELVKDQNEWNNDYLDIQMVRLMGNFSHERIEHIKKVIGVLYPCDNAETASNEFYYSGTASNYQSDEKENNLISGAAIVGGAAAGACVGGVISAIVGETVIGGAIAGAVVGGLIGFVSKKVRKL